MNNKFKSIQVNCIHSDGFGGCKIKKKQFFFFNRACPEASFGHCNMPEKKEIISREQTQPPPRPNVPVSLKPPIIPKNRQYK